MRNEGREEEGRGMLIIISSSGNSQISTDSTASQSCQTSLIMLKYLKDLCVCKSCLFFCLFQREQGLEKTWDWYQATFFQLICMILLFRSPRMVLRKEGRPLQV